MVVRLVADALAATVGSLFAGLLEDLIDRGALGVVDRDRADLLGQLQTVRVAVDEHHLRRALDHRRVRGQQSDGPTAVDRDRVAGQHPRELVACHPVGKMSESIT